MKIVDIILQDIIETKDEYINKCKKCFLKEPKKIQKELENADTIDLEKELKNHRFTSDWCLNYCNAIKYELMLRSDFEIEIH